MTKCNVCKEKLNKKWKYCPQCGGRIRSKTIFPTAKLSYVWERDESGAFIYKNFRAIRESKVFPLVERGAIRPILKDFCHINFYNLRKFALLLYNPNLVYDLYNACRLMGYYDSEKFARDAKLQKLIESLGRTNEFWRILKDKRFINASKKSFSKLGVGITDYVTDERKGEVIFRIKESMSTPIKSSTPCCPEQIGDFIGSLENFSYRFWNGIESKCISKGDDYCQFDMYITKTEENPKVNMLNKTEVDRILDEIIQNLGRDEETIYRKTIGDYVHISGEQCINYVLISKSQGHKLLAKYSGSIIGQKMAQQAGVKTEKELLEYLTNTFQYLRVGILDKPQHIRDVIKIQMRESMYSTGAENINQKLDTFIAGIIEGALKESTKQKWIVEEIKCIANGDDYCEFTCKKQT